MVVVSQPESICILLVYWVFLHSCWIILDCCLSVSASAHELSGNQTGGLAALNIEYSHETEECFKLSKPTHVYWIFLPLDMQENLWKRIYYVLVKINVWKSMQRYYLHVHAWIIYIWVYKIQSTSVMCIPRKSIGIISK